MKGVMAHRSPGIQFLMLFLLAALGSILFSALGIGFAMVAFDVGADQLLSALSDLAEAPSSSIEVFKTIQGFSTVGTFLFPALVGAYLFSHQPESFLRVDHFPRPVAVVLLLTVILSFTAGYVSDLFFRLSSLIPFPESLEWIEEYLSHSQEMMEQQYEAILQMENMLDFTEVFLVIAVLPAVAEEALFRGTMQPILVRGMGRHSGIVITAVLFALLHQQFLAFLSIFVLGITLGYVREWSKSLWLPTLIHLVNNGTIVVLVYFWDMPYGQISQTASGWGYSLAVSVIFVVCLWFTRKVLLANRNE